MRALNVFCNPPFPTLLKINEYIHYNLQKVPTIAVEYQNILHILLITARILMLQTYHKMSFIESTLFILLYIHSVFIKHWNLPAALTEIMKHSKIKCQKVTLLQ